MVAYDDRRVVEVIGARRGLIRVRLDDGSRAYALTQLTGTVAVGDDVVVNTTALDRGLGTGGWHVIHWNRSDPADPGPGPGHLMKLRYTSLQCDTGAAEELDPGGPEDVTGVPVVVAGLHSQLPVVAATIARRRPGTRVGYVMTDGGALPLALSDVVAQLVDHELLVGTVTAGHAFGGDHEALNVASGLVSARHRLGAELVVVALGPGVAGTASRLGFTGLEVASHLDTASWLGGTPVPVLRCSEADERARHRGISHHSRTVLEAVRTIVDVAHPPGIEPTDERHRWHLVDPGDVAATLVDAGLRVRTMGRGPEEDPVAFAAGAAAAELAVDLLDARGRP